MVPLRGLQEKNTAFVPGAGRDRGGNPAREGRGAACRRGKDFDPLEYATQETLTLSSIPSWEHLPTEEYQEAPTLP
jgi:hypothetical protein